MQASREPIYSQPMVNQERKRHSKTTKAQFKGSNFFDSGDNYDEQNMIPRDRHRKSSKSPAFPDRETS
jgi:hypothetical protein